ncbi:hypothetical protein [Actinomadura litoris]|uniref:Uncharacterized protein n=1 Tax=Actinomadura litoris TaxID=2678616 RepID=A0A7K1LAL7_9ACTN|nr:hypothetical protein [Actinomadura litoris]MUN41469.1 hypothetical protein [Actinomadura litoris]
MITATLPRPTGPGLDHDFVHVYCCDPDRAVCGLDVADRKDLGDADPSDEDCPWCGAIEQLGSPCGAVDCPDWGA